MVLCFVRFVIHLATFLFLYYYFFLFKMAMIMMNQLIGLGLFVGPLFVFSVLKSVWTLGHLDNFAKAALHEPRNWPQIKS